MSLAEVTRPAEVYMILDYYSRYGILANPLDHANFAANPTEINNIIPHLEGGAVAFADGHAKWLPRASLAKTGRPSTNCVLISPNYSYAYCDRSWNAYLE